MSDIRKEFSDVIYPTMEITKQEYKTLKGILKKKKIRRECWNLDYELIKWLNEHLKVYKEEASKIVDLEFYKFPYKKKEYTQLQILNRLIEITDNFLDVDYFTLDTKESEKLNKNKGEMYDLLKLVHWQLWW